MAMTRCVLVLSGSLLLAGCTPGAAPARRAESRLDLAPCLLPDAAGRWSIKALCGSWTVAEDRKIRGGRLLNLRVAVVPAVSRSPSPFPVMLLAGGPGQAASEMYGLVETPLQELHKTHDVVLIDQRGTGGSNALRCPELEPEALIQLDDAAVSAALVACRDALPADVAQYTTDIAIQDFEEVRQALGYPQVHLYGASYGTRVGLAYLRRYPGSIRTAVFDGVVPPSLALGSTIAPDAQRALQKMFERCAVDVRCQQRFPDLEARFDGLVRQLSHAPERLTLIHPRRGTPLDLELTREMMGTAVRLLSYRPETVALLPLLIDSAARGEWQPLAGQFLLVTDSLNHTISEIMGFAVTCTEDYPFFDAAELARLAAGSYLGEFQTDAMSRLCSDWPRGEVAADFHDDVSADVPVLLLSGENDPVTPPRYGEQVAASLPRALHVRVPGMGHNVFGRGCVPEIVTSFIEGEALEDIDPVCVAQVRPVPFFVSFSGSVPPAGSR